MVNVARIVATLSLVVGASHAYAATYLFRATGTAEPFYSVDGNFNSVANPSSMVHAGDAVKISFLLDTTGLQPESVFAADPNIHIYYAQLQSFRLDIGTYHSHAAGNAAGFASVELWDNHQIAGLGPVDQFSISAVRGITSSKSPVDLGTGAIYESFGINAFDFSGSARTSDSIDVEPPLTSYGSLSAYFGFVNSSTSLETVSSMSGLEASLRDVSAMPEPGSWALMITGFGLCGVRLRRRADDRSPAGAH